MKQILTPMYRSSCLYVCVCRVYSGQSKNEGFRGSNYWIITMSEPLSFATNWFHENKSDIEF